MLVTAVLAPEAFIDSSPKRLPSSCPASQSCRSALVGTGSACASVGEYTSSKTLFNTVAGGENVAGFGKGAWLLVENGIKPLLEAACPNMAGLGV